MVERVVANRSSFEVDLNEESDETDEYSDSSEDDDYENRPVSVHDMRRQAAEFVKRPESAVTTNSANTHQEISSDVPRNNLPRHTVF
jgi:hypothetical protein